MRNWSNVQKIFKFFLRLVAQNGTKSPQEEQYFGQARLEDNFAPHCST
jgi:hypothetical protein